jgi:hypothetical protein
MAQAIHCDGCENEQAVMLITNLDNGDVLGLGPACFPTWCAAMGETVQAALEGPPAEDVEQAQGDTPEGVTDGISPNNPATYPPAHEDPDADPHAPAETGPSSPSDVPVPTDPSIDPEHPHAPAVTGPGTYGEEGGVIAPAPDPAPVAPAEAPATADPADTPTVEQLAPSPAFV